jgi:acetyl esterase/lipase
MNQAKSIGLSRRRFAMAGLSAGAALVASGLFAEDLRPLTGKNILADLPAIKPGTNTSFAP